MDDNSKNKKNTKSPQFKHLDMQTANSVSSTDFTGLIPANPRGEDISEYEDIHGFGNDIEEEK